MYKYNLFYTDSQTLNLSVLVKYINKELIPIF